MPSCISEHLPSTAVCDKSSEGDRPDYQPGCPVFPGLWGHADLHQPTPGESLSIHLSISHCIYVMWSELCEHKLSSVVET